MYIFNINAHPSFSMQQEYVPSYEKVRRDGYHECGTQLQKGFY